MQINHLLKRYDARFCLDIPALTFYAGEKIAILGPNGSGKSTLLKILAGVLKNEDEKIELPQCGYLPQKSYAFDLSVLKNVEYALWDTDKKQRKQKALEALKRTGMEALADAKAEHLSGGETQRLALSRVICRNPQILLLDEPTAACDIESEKKIEAVLQAFKGTLLFSTHAPAQALRLADRIFFLDNGHLMETGKTENVLFHPTHQRVQEYMQHWRV